MDLKDAGIDYRERQYLSVGEVATLTGLSVKEIHGLVKAGDLQAFRSGSGQYRFQLSDVRRSACVPEADGAAEAAATRLQVNGTAQRLVAADSTDMSMLADGSVHLAVTSPPYFNAKMYSESCKGDLGNIHDLDEWLETIGKVWREVHRVLSPGRKFFLNIMNLPVRVDKSFRSLNLVGKSADLCEQAGFIFKRDIVWHKTNGVRAHFGTFPNPGGILLNNMHEFILEFEKPAPAGFRKYAHVSEAQRQASKLDKDFWLSLKNTDVWLMKPEKSGGGREHAAPFPLELPERLIRAYSYQGETILDPFAGSGTTLVAASLWGRNGIGFELNPSFCRMAATRIQREGRPRWEQRERAGSASPMPTASSSMCWSLEPSAASRRRRA